MAIKKTELYNSLWRSCDELRGGMDASQYKDYILVLLFVKYVSDKWSGKKDAPMEVPAGGSFADLVALKGKKDIGDKINVVIGKLAEANNLKGVITLADWNDPDKLGKDKEMVDRLTRLVAIFEDPSLDFGSNRADGDDLLGDAYEYLMRNFATESGKSKGQFYTPAEVSRVMAKVVGMGAAKRKDQTLYDPTCGSGSLLLKAAAEAPKGITIYGQEKDNATAGLARMNMILHDSAEAEIWQDNTLTKPHWTTGGTSLKAFDFVVSNPPFSDKAWSTGLKPAEDLFDRFRDGVPPAKNGDYAYLLHVLASMKSSGRGAIIMPHDVLFRGNSEAEIRRSLLKRAVVEGIIGLPPNLFYGTGIPACIVVLDKGGAGTCEGVFMIDASGGFAKDGPKNRLRHRDIHKIVDVYLNRKEIDGYSRLIPLPEIAKNEWNLNIPRYIDSSEARDSQDIEAHLRGGIPARDIEGLSAYWKVCPKLRSSLFARADRPGYFQCKIEARSLKEAILGHPEFVVFTAMARARFDVWWQAALPRLRKIGPSTRCAALASALSEELLAAFADASLVDPYDPYQTFMEYWDETMHDDAQMVAAEGWVVASRLRPILEETNKDDEGSKKKEKPDIQVGKLKLKADLIPPQLVIVRFFAEAQAAINAIQAELDEVEREMEEARDEGGGEEGLLSEVLEDGKIARPDLVARLKALGDSEGEAEEREALLRYRDLMDRGAEIGRRLKEAQKSLDAAVVERYGKLSEVEVKNLVVGDKWGASLATAFDAEIEAISSRLTGRIRELTERYEKPLSELEAEVRALTAKVNKHLAKMGFEING
jgi:type I restriction enzyme M protein